MEVRKAESSHIGSVDFDNLIFGRTFTDHMIQCDYDGEQWGEIVVKPLESFQMHPASQVLHYGQAVFEGLKAYRTDEGKVNLFRVTDNLRRLNVSAERLAIPPINPDVVLKALEEWLKLDYNWVPAQHQGSLYIRPFLFATSNTLRAMPSIKYTFMLIASPVGFYYSEPIRVKVESNYTRAARGGVGYAKAAGNYAAAFMPTIEAKGGEFDQLLWTDQTEHNYLEELGSANLFFMANNCLYTPNLHDSILAGITRDSVITIARSKGIEVEEKAITKAELESLLREGKVQCLFATGTAAAITFIKDIDIDGHLYHVDSLNEFRVMDIKKQLEEIKWARRSEPYGWNHVY